MVLSSRTGEVFGGQVAPFARPSVRGHADRGWRAILAEDRWSTQSGHGSERVVWQATHNATPVRTNTATVTPLTSISKASNVLFYERPKV